MEKEKIEKVIELRREFLRETARLGELLELGTLEPADVEKVIERFEREPDEILENVDLEALHVILQEVQ